VGASLDSPLKYLILTPTPPLTGDLESFLKTGQSLFFQGIPQGQADSCNYQLQLLAPWKAENLIPRECEMNARKSFNFLMLGLILISFWVSPAPANAAGECGMPVPEIDPSTWGNIGGGDEYQRTAAAFCNQTLYAQAWSIWAGREPSGSGADRQNLTGYWEVHDMDLGQIVDGGQINLSNNPREDGVLYFDVAFPVPADGHTYRIEIFAEVRQAACGNGTGSSLSQTEGSVPAPRYDATAAVTCSEAELTAYADTQAVARYWGTLPTGEVIPVTEELFVGDFEKSWEYSLPHGDYLKDLHIQVLADEEVKAYADETGQMTCGEPPCGVCEMANASMTWADDELIINGKISGFGKAWKITGPNGTVASGQGSSAEFEFRVLWENRGDVKIRYQGWVLGFDDVWRSSAACNFKPKLLCPECGPRVEEEFGNASTEEGIGGFQLVFWADHCEVEPCNTLELSTQVLFRGFHPSVLLYKGEPITGEKITTLAGDVRVTKFPFTWVEDGENFVLLDETGILTEEHRLRTVFGPDSVEKYISCSLTVGDYDILIVGDDLIAQYTAPQTIWDWQWYIIREKKLLDNSQESWDQVANWALELRSQGQLSLGRLSDFGNQPVDLSGLSP
jgi:hypothetical protein